MKAVAATYTPEPMTEPQRLDLPAKAKAVLGGWLELFALPYTADRLIPTHEKMIREAAAGILNTRGVPIDTRRAACVALSEQHGVALKGISE